VFHNLVPLDQGDQMIGKKISEFFNSSQNINIKPLETFKYLTTNHVLKLLAHLEKVKLFLWAPSFLVEITMSFQK
jgi:hypothetical protein